MHVMRYAIADGYFGTLVNRGDFSHTENYRDDSCENPTAKIAKVYLVVGFEKRIERFSDTVRTLFRSRENESLLFFTTFE